MTRRSVSHTPLHKNCKGAKSSLLLLLCNFRSCFEFLQKVFLGLMYPFSCVLWAIFFLRQIARYLPHHRSENASKTHPKSSHDKFKTASTFAA